MSLDPPWRVNAEKGGGRFAVACAQAGRNFRHRDAYLPWLFVERVTNERITQSMAGGISGNGALGLLEDDVAGMAGRPT
jgi:hypothetical protein